MKLKKVALLTAAALLISGCAAVGRADPPAAAPGYIAQLVLPAESAGSVQGLVTYNPFSTNPLTRTWLYEPLMIRQQFTCEAVPWLATAYSWKDPSTLLLTIRQGVKWSDGVPMTAADVAFTLNLGKKYPATDKAGVWGKLFGAPATAITAAGAVVTIKFAGPAPSKLDNILTLTQVLPEHIWAGVGDPTSYIDAKGIGTGPFVVGSYNGRQLILLRNKSYWQADKIKVQQLSLEGSYDSNSAALKLRNGGLDLYLGDIPNPAKSVAKPGSGDAFYYSPAGTTVLAPNNQKFPFNDPKFRVAMAYGIDKAQLARKASFGVMGVGSQTMLKLPVQANQVPPAYRSSGGIIAYDPAKAAAMFDAAGYKKGGNGFRVGPKGQPISIVFSVQAEYIDYLAMADVIVRNLKAIGFDITEVVTDPNAVDAQKKSGDFDMVFDYVNGGCIRSKDFGGKLATDQISKGPDLLLNVARYSNPDVDKLVEAYDNSIDPSKVQSYTDQLVDIFMKQMPYIALQYAPQRLIYRETAASGWPSASNPYPSDSLLYLMTHLTAATS